MIRISKNHDAFKKIKNIIKTNQYKNLTIADDLQILKIVDAYNLQIDTLLYCYDVTFHDDTYKLLQSLIKKSKEVYEISMQSFQSLALKENHAGIIASVIIPEYTIEQFKTKKFLFVLDSLEIPGNIGTILRTLNSINIDGVILVDSISKLYNSKLTIASRGCNLIVPTLSLSYDMAQSFLQDNNFEIYLGEPNLGENYTEYNYNNKIAIVVGNERFGINSDWYNHNHKKVFIPMEGDQNSLNVGVAASILAYEAYMKRKFKIKR